MGTREPVCPKCRYAVAGLRGPRCPECGGPIDLDNPYYGSIALARTSAVGWWITLCLALLIVAAAIALGIWSGPSVAFLGLFMPYLLLSTVKYWILPVALCAVCLFLNLRSRAVSRRRWAVMCTSLTFAAISLIFPQWAALAIFYTHLPALNALADELEASGTGLRTLDEPGHRGPPATTHRVGLYKIKAKCKLDGVQVWFPAPVTHGFLFRSSVDGDPRYIDTLYAEFWSKRLTSRWLWWWPE